MVETTTEMKPGQPFETPMGQKTFVGEKNLLGEKALAGDLEAGSVTSPIEGVVVDWPDASPKKADNGGMQGDENTTFPEVKFYAEAEVHNPNLLGGEADPGDIQVFFRGQNVGDASSQPMTMSPQSTRIVGANSTIRLNYHLFQAMTNEVLMNELKLTLQVSGGAWVTGPLGVRLFIKIECDIHTSVDQVFNEEARHKVVTGKECQYKYF